MKLGLTGLFREDAINYNRAAPPGRDNPGGGLAKKAYMLTLALPTLELVSTTSRLRDITIIEPLWLTGFEPPEGQDFKEMVMQRVGTIAAYPGYKILWTCDLELLRWEGEIREQLLDAVDVVAGNSQYMVDLLSAYVDASKLAYLTDPVDCRQTTPPVPKQKSIYGCSQIIYEKGIRDLSHVYCSMESLDLRDWERLFIGSTDTWGDEFKPEVAAKLDKELDEACTGRIKAATWSQVDEVAALAFAFLSFAGFESFGYAMIEALLAGCWVFCGDHLVYRDRPVHWFCNVDDAVVALADFLENADLTQVNEAGRQFVIDNYDLMVFRSQFANIVGRSF